MNRRDFLKTSAAGSAVALFPYPSLYAQSPEPHFFVHLVFYGGLDVSSTFDARPLKMTQDGLIQNYFGQEPNLWTGTNGTTTWATRGVDELKSLQSYFSLLNGVVMSPNFDAHIQNLNFLLSGNPFGGTCFMPELNHRPLPLDGIMQGTSPAQLNNMGSFIPTTYQDLASLIKLIKSKKPIDPTLPAWKFLMSRYAASSNGSGRFSKAIELMLNSVPKSAEFEHLIKSVNVTPPASEEAGDLPILSTVGEFFRKQIVRSVLIVENINIDSHSAGEMKLYPEKIVQYTKRVKRLIEFLRTEQFDSKRSLMDVTTFMVSSEIGRTMRQLDVPIDQTGTDHNNFATSMMLGGKGVRPGMIVGGTDFQSSQEVLSQAHMAVDSKKVKCIGRPFDFSTLSSKNSLPAKFEAKDYLTVGSVVNSIYEIGGVKSDKYWKVGTDVAPTLKGLLA